MLETQRLDEEDQWILGDISHTSVAESQLRISCADSNHSAARRTDGSYLTRALPAGAGRCVVGERRYLVRRLQRSLMQLKQDYQMATVLYTLG